MQFSALLSLVNSHNASEVFLSVCYSVFWIKVSSQGFVWESNTCLGSRHPVSVSEWMVSGQWSLYHLLFMQKWVPFLWELLWTPSWIPFPWKLNMYCSTCFQVKVSESAPALAPSHCEWVSLFAPALTISRCPATVLPLLLSKLVATPNTLPISMHIVSCNAGHFNIRGCLKSYIKPLQERRQWYHLLLSCNNHVGKVTLERTSGSATQFLFLRQFAPMRHQSST